MSAFAVMLGVAAVVSAGVVVEAAVVAAAAGAVVFGVVGSAVGIAFVVVVNAVGPAPELEALGSVESFESKNSKTVVTTIFYQWYNG